MQEAIQGCSWCGAGCILDVQKVIWHGDRLNYGWSIWIWGGSPLTFIRNCHRFNLNGPQMWKPRPPQTSLPGCNLSSDLLLLNMTRFCRGENWRKQHTHGELLGGGCQEKQTIISGGSGNTWRCKPLLQASIEQMQARAVCSKCTCLNPDGEIRAVEGKEIC